MTNTDRLPNAMITTKFITNTSLVATMGTLAFAVGSVNAAVTLADFEFDSDLTSSDASTSWTTTNLSSGGGVPTGFDGSLGQPAPSLALTMGDINDGTLLDDDYYSFSITPGASAELDFTQFTFDIYKVSGGASVTGRLYSSIDAFTAELGNGTISALTTWETKTIDLSGLAPVTAATEFRLYLETGGTFGPNGVKLDNLTLDGDVTVVPEPSTTALLGLGGLALILRRRQ